MVVTEAASAIVVDDIVGDGQEVAVRDHEGVLRLPKVFCSN